MALAERYRQVRARTEALAAPLSPEDQQLQSMPACSPTKWHRAHTTWFFEELVLGVESRWRVLFNSYYEAMGARHPRPQRGLLSRPSCAEIAAYRAEVDDRVLARLAQDPSVAARVELGLAHEEQHQELILTDIVHAFAQHPLRPAYAVPRTEVPRTEVPRTFTAHAGGLVAIGGEGAGFRFDNEEPRHQVYLEPFELADRLVTVGEARAFAEDGGYRTPSLWLSDGWDLVKQHGWHAPGYSDLGDDDGRVFGATGLRTPSPGEPVAFVSFYEADAIARWMGARLPTEAEWETAARARPVRGNFLDERLVPTGSDSLYGDCWQWTRSSYEPYPGFAPADGALGEYNGKFMINQRVLRGGSCFTPAGHVRATYRNFWHPDTRFQVTGIRLARGA
jgi:ergothioneine biosynthesis protein EgtB